MSDLPPYFPSSPNPYPQPPRSMSPWVVFGILAAFVILFGILVMGLIAIWISQTTVRYRADMGKPLHSSPLKKGWKAYQIPALGIQIASPFTPKATFYKSMVTHRPLLREVALYRIQGGGLVTHLYGYWMKKKGATPESMAQARSNAFRNAPYKVLSLTQAPVRVAGLDGVQINYNYILKGKESVCKSISLRKDNVSYYFEGIYFRDAAESAGRVFDSELKSIRWLE